MQTLCGVRNSGKSDSCPVGESIPEEELFANKLLPAWEKSDNRGGKGYPFHAKCIEKTG